MAVAAKTELARAVDRPRSPSGVFPRQRLFRTAIAAGLLGLGIAHAQNGPVPFRNLPVERAVRTQLARHIHYITALNFCRGGC